MKLHLILKLAPLVILLGCDVGKVRRTQHEGPKQTKTEIPVEPPVNPHEFEKSNLETVHAQLKTLLQEQNSAQAATLGKQIMQQLENFVVNSNYILDPRFAASNRSRVMLSYYNTAFVKLLSLDNKAYDAELDKYFKIVSRGCDENLRGCSTISFFKQDHRSAQILVYYAQKLDREIDGKESNLDLVKSYYDSLALALELKNIVRDRDIDFLYIKRARQYALLHKSLPEEKKNTDVMKRHGRIFEQIVNSYPNNPNNQEFKKFVSNFPTWTYSRLEADPFPFGIRKMFSFAASNSFYEDKEKTKLSSDLKKAIAESQFVSATCESQVQREKQKYKDSFGPSFKQIVRDLKCEPTVPFLFRAFNVDTSKVENNSFFDEYFYMVDRLYRGHWDSQEATEVWLGSKQDSRKLVEVLEYYIKIQFLDMIVRTNKYVSNIVTQPDMNNENLVKQTIERSRQMSDVWKDSLARIEGRLGVFLGANLRNNNAAEKSLDDAQKLIDSLRRNIKYLSVYPNLILLTYFIHEMNSKIEVMTFFGPYDLTSSTIIENLFSGTLEVLFDFGNDTYTLNKIQLLQAYYYALMTGSFETYAGQGVVSSDKESTSQKKLSKVDRKSFFEKVIRQYLNRDRERLQRMSTYYKTNATDNSFSNRLRECQMLKNNESDFTIELDLNKFMNGAIYGNPANVDNGLMADLFKIYKVSDAAGDYSAFKDVHSALTEWSIDADRVLESRMVYLQIMVDILKENMRDLNFDQKDIDSIHQAAQQEITFVRNLSDQVYKDIIAQHKEASSCIHTFLDLERKRQMDLLKMEQEHLGKVYDLMISLKGKASESYAQAMQTRGRELGFEPDLDAITSNGYRYNRMNVFRRMAARSAELKPAVNVTFPSNWKEDDMAAQNQTLSISKQNGELVSKQEFIRNGMSYFGKRRDPLVRWLPKSADLTSLLQKLNVMTELYRYSQIKNFEAKEAVSADEVVTEAMQLLRYSSINPEEEQFLKSLGDLSRVELRQLENVLLKETQQPRGLADYVYEQLSNQKVIRDDAKMLYLEDTQKARFLFSTDKDSKEEPNGKFVLKTKILNSYKPLVLAHEKALVKFKNSVKAMEAQWAAGQAGQRYLYKIFDNNPYYFDLSPTSDQKLELISDRSLESVQGKINEFHLNTGGEFKLKEAQQ